MWHHATTFLSLQPLPSLLITCWELLPKDAQQRARETMGEEPPLPECSTIQGDVDFQNRIFGPHLAIGRWILWAMKRLALQVMSQKMSKSNVCSPIPCRQLRKVLSSIKRGALEAMVLFECLMKIKLSFFGASISADKLFIPVGLHDFISVCQCLSWKLILIV